MPVIYDDPNKRRRYDAFRTLDEAKVNPLSEAVRVAVAIDDDIDRVEKFLKDPNVSKKTKGALANTLMKLRQSSFYAWKEIAEFVYAKPKAEVFDPERDAALQGVINKTQMLELIQKLNYPERKANGKPASNGNGNGASH